MRTGWDRNRRAHFDHIVENYDRARPTYPRELFEDILAYSGAEAGARALEIGPGTGKATAPILDAGLRVTAVELGANMTEFLREKFKERAGFRVINAAFEDATLDADSYRLVYAASAFHWVDAEIGCPKVFRVLERGGAFAVFRKEAVPALGEACYEEMQRSYEKYYYPHYQTDVRPVRKAREDYLQPAGVLGGFGFEDLRRYGFGDIRVKLYDMERTFAADEYIALLDTHSTHGTLPQSVKGPLYAELRETILRHGGQYREAYVCQLCMGRKEG